LGGAIFVSFFCSILSALEVEPFGNFGADRKAGGDGRQDNRDVLGY